MFNAPELKEHLANAHTVRSKANILAEINLNDPGRISYFGNYKCSPAGGIEPSSIWSPDDPQIDGGTISYESIDGANGAEQTVFNQVDNNLKLLYPIEDIFKNHRPRSGINKLMHFDNYIDDIPSANRPRYYVSSRNDPFKYWTSYRREGSDEKGISTYVPIGNSAPIQDANPFVVYKETLPANRIVIKFQTHTGTENKGPFMDQYGQLFDDPFYGQQNNRGPKEYKVEALRQGTWSTLYQFLDVPPSDGYVELGYGVLTDKDIIIHGYLESSNLLPPATEYDDNAAFIVGSGKGTLYINNNGWQESSTEYGWAPVQNHHKVVHIMDPMSFDNGSQLGFREFDTIDGLRLVVNSMPIAGIPLDIIELSPRLVIDLTERTVEFGVTKSMGDLGNAALPVGELLAGTGEIVIDNTDMALAESFGIDFATGEGSVMAKFLEDPVKFYFTETIYNVNGKAYTVPIKTLYADAMPQMHNEPTKVQLQLRDAFTIFEGATPPEIMLENVSLSRAIMVLLDGIGFSNYAFLRGSGPEPVIPYFFVNPQTNVAEILGQLSQSTQSAMYFDEFNNFIVAMPEYAIPDTGQRSTDLILRADDNDGLANIQDISSMTKEIYNAGELTFTKRYIQRTNRLSQSLYRDKDREWIYAPVMVWEVQGNENTKGGNEEIGEQSAYALAAFPLALDLNDSVPYVEGGIVKNNVIDVGESINYYANYQGYLWADGEIIRYDAIEFSVTGEGNVWIESADEYQDYFLNLPFAGRIYPTGLIRIYAKPNTVEDSGTTYLEDGPIDENGRGQFSTQITSHIAGLDSDWNTNVQGMFQNADYLFTLASTINYPASLTTSVPGGQSWDGVSANDRAINSANRTSEIRDSLAMADGSEIDKLQASALVFTGANESKDHVSYAYKTLDKPYESYGARMRIIGEILTDGNQEPLGAQVLTKPFSNTPMDDLAISGGGGGIGFNINPATNHGYFMELAALNNAEYALEEIEQEQQLGKIAAASVTNDLVKLTMSSTPSGLEIGDTVTVSEFPSETLDINGIHEVSNITNNDIYYKMTIVPFTWTAPWDAQTITKHSGSGLASISMSNVLRIAVDDKGEVLVTTDVNHGFLPGTKLNIAGFEFSSSMPNINGIIDIIWSSNQEFKYKILPISGSFIDTINGTTIAYSGKTIGSDVIDSATVTATDITFNIGETSTIFPELPPALAGTSLVLDRENLAKNPRFGKAGSTVIVGKNLANDTRANLKNETKVGRWKPNWRLYTGTPPKTNGGLKAKAQEWVATGGPSPIATFTRISYMKGTAWDQRGFLLAGNPNPQNVSVSSIPSSGDDYTSALVVNAADSKVQIGFWIKASKSTKAYVMGRRSDRWTKYDTKKKTNVSNEFQIGSTISVTTKWKWVTVTYTASPAFAANTRLHLRIKFASSSAKIDYSATGLQIQTNNGVPIYGKWFDAKYTPDSNYSASQQSNHSRLSYDTVKYVTNVGNVRTTRAKIYSEDDPYTLQVMRTVKGGTAYAKVDLGTLAAGRYVFSIIPYAKDERFKEDFIPYLVLNNNEATKIENLWPRVYESGEKNDGTRPSGVALRNINVNLASSANVQLRLPTLADVGGSIYYDSLHVEKVPANILTADIENLTYFNGDQTGAKWKDGPGFADDSTSIIDDADIGTDARSSVTSITGTNTLTITTAAANAATVGQWAVFAGVQNLLTAYKVTERLSSTQFRIVTVGVAGSLTDAQVAFIPSVRLNVPSLSIVNQDLYPLAIEQDESGAGIISVQRAGVPGTLDNPFRLAKATKTWVDTPKLFNVFFYKTVSDDRGGNVTGGSGNELIVPNHTLRRGDIVKISNAATQYVVSNVIGNRLVLSFVGGGNPSFTPGNWWVGLVTPLITPFRLWAGLTPIIVDNGKLYGQQRQVGEPEQSIYDISVETSNSGTTKIFHLYINDKLVGTARDEFPLDAQNNAALFVRGQSKVMFEHFYALSPKNGIPSNAGLAEVTNNQSRFDSVRRSGIAGPMRSAIMQGFGSGVSDYDIFYDEFGTIFREAAFMNVKYDQAYPALISQIAPAPAGFRGYEISGFLPTAYGAEFMLFNCTDNLLALTESTGNYLRILGVVFTQNTTKTIELSDLLSRDADSSKSTNINDLEKIKSLRDYVAGNKAKFGEKKFTIETEYVQSTAAAEKLMHWIASKVTRPRQAIGVTIFPNSMIQLGDLVSFDFKIFNKDTIDPNKQYVVYNINYQKSAGELTQNIYLVEV